MDSKDFQLLGADAETFMRAEDLLTFLKGRVGILEGVCITGGEPTLQKDLPELLRAIKEMGFAVLDNFPEEHIQ